MFWMNLVTITANTLFDDWSLKYLSTLFMKAVIILQSTAPEGREFQTLMTRLKNKLLASFDKKFLPLCIETFLHLCYQIFWIFRTLPLVHVARSASIGWINLVFQVFLLTQDEFLSLGILLTFYFVFSLIFLYSCKNGNQTWV